MWARLDGFKNRLRAIDDELGRKSLEMEVLANTVKEAKAENKQLQAELEKGRRTTYIWPMALSPSYCSRKSPFGYVEWMTQV
jgi:hypothetical protein